MPSRGGIAVKRDDAPQRVDGRVAAPRDGLRGGPRHGGVLGALRGPRGSPPGGALVIDPAMASYECRFGSVPPRAQGSPTLPHRSGPAHPAASSTGSPWRVPRFGCRGSVPARNIATLCLTRGPELPRRSTTSIATTRAVAHAHAPRRRTVAQAMVIPCSKPQGEPDPSDAAVWANPGHGAGPRRTCTPSCSWPGL